MEGGRKIMEVGDWVLVWNGGVVQCAVVTTRAPVTGLRFGNHVEGRRPRAVGRSHDAKVQHVLEFVFGNFEAVGWKSAGSGGGGWATCKNVVGYVVFDSGLFGGWSRDVGVFTENVHKWRRWKVRIARVDSRHGRGDNVNTEVGNRVDKAVVANVDNEIEMAEKISTNDRLGHVSNGEDPRETPTETKVESQ